ncbi:error-prone DNA polymerase [Pseudidiomarina donghaiensis]|uniref:error-prone DNA polymerase n=1 Tax=Pseudidiomarina donghaiensis TaxID=519452 RepID=UPI003A984824
MAGLPNGATMSLPTAQDLRPAALHCLSNFSFLRGASHPHELVERACQLGYQALAITDECSVAGVVRAYVAARDKPLRLIIGSEFNLPELGTFIVLVRNRQGYAQLCQLITKARNRCKKGHYQVTLSDFVSTLPDCNLLWRLPQTDSGAELIEQTFVTLKQHYPARLWLAYGRHYQAHDADSYRWYQQLSEAHKVPVAAVCEVYYHQPKRQALHDVLVAIRQRQPIDSLVTQLKPNQDYCLRSPSELTGCYPEAWLAQTIAIAKQCCFCLSELRYEYPAELVPEGRTATDYLRELTYAGAALRFPEGLRTEVQAKLEKELALIAQLNYEYFFLTIHDIVQFAQQRGILYQGRGSAANSVVCYCLQITAVNPDQIDVLFERFISAERDEPPDIDVDFEHERREEVIQYIYQKYGRHRAALAATVIRYRLRSALRDVGKALGFHEQELSHYLRQVDRRDGQQSWQQQLTEKFPGLQASYRGRCLLKLTQSILGFPRHLSQHVGGFVIAATQLTDLVPVENASMPDRTVIQWDKDDLETLHLIKVDVLALGMLTALRKMFALVKQHHQRDLGLADIIQEDAAVYGMLQRADSIGVFQIESRAQMNMLPRLRPSTFYDLVVQIAIVRPGPIQGDMVHPYLRRRAGIEPVTFPSEAVREVLQRTLGVPIFQEQVIKLAMVAAGFSGGEADQLRRAMANWKSSGELRQFESKLIAGMRERGYSDEFAQRIFQQICGFGEYGFPESHSASFANLAYASAWLKYYYPAAFYCGLLNSLPMGFYSASQLIQDAKRHHINVLPIDIQHSQWHHQLELGQHGLQLRLGLRLVKGLRQSAIDKLLSQRPQGGFKHLQQLRAAGLSGADLHKLAAADALQALSGHRHESQWQSLALQVEQLPLFAEATAPNNNATSYDLQAHPLPPPAEFQDVAVDYKTTGVSIRRHPVALLREQQGLTGYKLASELAQCRHKQLVRVAGLVTCRQRPGTASGVTFVTLEDESGLVNVVIWQQTARSFRQTFLTAQLLKVKGVVEIHGDVIHVIAGHLEDGTEQLAQLGVAANRSRDFH